jgi:hypothetical protein
LLAALPGASGTSSSAAKPGSIGRIALQLRDFDYSGVRVDVGNIEFNSLTYLVDEAGTGSRSEESMKVTGAGPSKAHLVVSAASLQKLMQGRIKDVQDLRLSLQNDRVKITGTRPAPLIGVPMPFSLDGRLEARQGDQLWLSDAQLSLGGAPVPAAMTKSILNSMNPIYVVDFTQRWNFRTDIKTIAARNNKLDITGNLVFMRPAATSPATRPPAATPSVTPRNSINHTAP